MAFQMVTKKSILFNKVTKINRLSRSERAIEDRLPLPAVLFTSHKKWATCLMLCLCHQAVEFGTGFIGSWESKLVHLYENPAPSSQILQLGWHQAEGLSTEISARRR